MLDSLGLGSTVAVTPLCLSNTTEKGPVAAAVAPSPEAPWANENEKLTGLGWPSSQARS